jgi:hypothetical protein
MNRLPEIGNIGTTSRQGFTGGNLNLVQPAPNHVSLETAAQ